MKYPNFGPKRDQLSIKHRAKLNNLMGCFHSAKCVYAEAAHLPLMQGKPHVFRKMV